MTVSQRAASPVRGGFPHPAPVRSPGQSREAQNDRSSGATPCNMTRLIAVTVALSEPLDAPELDWADTIAANLRTIYTGTTVEIIDTWRTDE